MINVASRALQRAHLPVSNVACPGRLVSPRLPDVGVPQGFDGIRPPFPVPREQLAQELAGFAGDLRGCRKDLAGHRAIELKS